MTVSAPRTLICGSLALDTIMVFPDRFARHILPGETHVLSVSFQIGEMRREWGGCAGNIAYNLKRLGGEPVVMATVGDDGDAYVERLKAQQVAADGVRVVPGTYTAQAFIITDLDDNQITAFHPGAMNESHRNRVTDVGRYRARHRRARRPRRHARARAASSLRAKVPFLFDPGQGLPLFTGAELIEMIDCANYLAVNDYEAQLARRTHRAFARSHGSARRSAVRNARARGIAHLRRGQDVSTLRRSSRPAWSTRPVAVMPTAPDCYTASGRVGTGSARARLASVLGSLKIAERGGQNHAFSRAAVAALYDGCFGEALF